MAYIEAHQSLLSHRKTLRLSRLLGMDRFCVVGHLDALWSWALDDAPEGWVSSADVDPLSDVMGWEREPSALCESLVSASFLDVSDDGQLVIHDWDAIGGKVLRRIAADAERIHVTDRLRRWVMEQDSLVCGICGEAVAKDDVHIDHMVPVSKGGKSTLDNLRVTHRSCNIAKSNQMPASAGTGESEGN